MTAASPGIHPTHLATARSSSIPERVIGELTPRRVLQIGLGLVWLLDAALQYQPYMFGRSFVTQIIEPAAAGNPSAVSQSVAWSAHLMLHHIALYNTFFATIQLILALGIIYRPTLRPALAASIVWAVCVWWFGEALGGSLSGASPIMGVPGGVVIYAMIALVLWPRDVDAEPGDPPAFAGLLGRRGAQALWLALWGSFTWYLLLPGNRARTGLGSMIKGMIDGEPSWVKSIDRGLANLIGQDGTEWSIALALICAVVALGVLARPSLAPVVIVAGLLGAVIWCAEAFGGIFTGRGTDPNSGLLLVLLAACYFPYGGIRPTSVPAPRS